MENQIGLNAVNKRLMQRAWLHVSIPNAIKIQPEQQNLSARFARGHAAGPRASLSSFSYWEFPSMNVVLVYARPFGTATSQYYPGYQAALSVFCFKFIIPASF